LKSYGIDPALITLEEFRKLITGKKMLPGRVGLLEQTEERFASLKNSGIRDLGQLNRALANRSKTGDLSEKTGLPVSYLILLKREAGSYLARPFPLSEFPGIPFEYAELLKSRGIRHTGDFFEKLQSEQQLARMASDTGIPDYRLRELLALCDLSRITGVGGVFARILYEAGIRSTEAFSSMEIQTTLPACREVIKKHGYPAGKIGEEDFLYSLHYARVVVSADRQTDKK